MSFTIRYAIPMKHQSCAQQVETKLKSYKEIESVDVNLDKEEAVVKGTLPPNEVFKAMQSIGRDAFVRGSGKPNSSAVSILEDEQGKVHGLVRLIVVSDKRMYADLSIDAKYAGGVVSVYKYGNISAPPTSLGDKLFDIQTENVYKDKETVRTMTFLENVELPNLIGKSVYVSTGLVGIIASSAGLWENDKTVCACTGKTLWEERSDARKTNSGLY